MACLFWYNEEMNEPSKQTIAEVLKTLDTSERGLSGEEALLRLKKYGKNALPEKRPESYLGIFFRQFRDPLIYVLFAAMGIIFFIGETTDALIILFILLFNSVVGAVQEGRAKNTFLAIKKFIETSANVLRDGKEEMVSDEEVVPGDIIFLKEGEKVPADARVIFSNGLHVDESSITGESLPVDKNPDPLKGDGILAADQRNMLFKGTHVVSGSGTAVVVATGIKTLVGKIAVEISAIDTEIPLRASIERLSHLIIYLVAGICLFLFVVGLLMGKPVSEMFAVIVSLAVSVIPEGLPVVITLILATGVWRMSKKNALIKRLQAVEALGQARIIAVDKTGTVTKNEMTVQEVYVGEKMFRVAGSGYEPKGEIYYNDRPVVFSKEQGLAFAGKISAYCASARAVYSEDRGRWMVSGDPTEAAMLVLAQKIGFYKEEIEQKMPQTAEIPFGHTTKYHAVIHASGADMLMTVVGAPEVMLGLSAKLWTSRGEQLLTEKDRAGIEDVFRKMSEKGLRVVAFSVTKEAPAVFEPENIKGLTFVGLLGMKDTLRPEVAGATKKAEAAGIRVVMITGDHQITAVSVAREAGIYHEGDGVLTGEEINALSVKELAEKIGNVSVFARVSPEHKLQIINAFKERGEVIAMTGDGVNDAPSLVAADLGVAMGKIGTEVAKEAADIVLLDDNFGSIVSAVEEGRNIHKNIKKVILYLFSTNFGEVFTITAALFMGLPIPLLAGQIIWLNFVTDSFLDIALAMEPKSRNLLRGNFGKTTKYIIDKPILKRILLISLVMSTGSVLLFQSYLGSDISKALTVSLTVLAVFQWFNAWNCRSEKTSLFTQNPFANIYLVGATFIVVALQMFAVYNPVMQKILHTVPLSGKDWLLILAVASSVIIAEEIRKFFARR